jgi:NAD(P)-dependent dehydrogenase (short-subunit alcohol dehydrogenase family)
LLPERVLCDYRNRRVIVSGCASGIGQATARLLMQQGAEVYGLDRHAPQCALGSFQLVDLRERSAIDAAVERVGGKVDALFNCAGLGLGHEPLDILKVNFLGARYLAERTLARMDRGGAIVNVSSNAGLGWRAHLCELRVLVEMESFEELMTRLLAYLPRVANAYAFSKELLTVWSLQQSARLIQRGIRINCTSPGAVQTPMLADIETRVPRSAILAVEQPIGRRSSPEEQAWPLLWLNSEAASYVNGVDLPVDGGFAARALLDNRAAQSGS